MATVVTVVFGIGLGMTGYTIIWPLFGAANKLLAALALLAVCAWLGNAGKNNRMFYLPMVFMLVVTVTSLCMTIQVQGSVLLGLVPRRPVHCRGADAHLGAAAGAGRHLGRQGRKDQSWSPPRPRKDAAA